jgi:chromate transporter
MLPMIQSEVSARWGNVISEQAIVDFVAVSESTPGPFAVNMATYVGAELGGIFGAACSTLGVVLPSFIIILIVAKCYEKFRNSSIVKGCMTGLKPAVVGMIGGAVLNVATTVFFPAGLTIGVLTGAAFYVSLAISAVMLVLALKKVHPIVIVCLSALVGIGAGYLGIWS